jgi:hypothetical protein
MVASEHTIDNIIQFPLQRADVNITRGFYTAKQAARLSRVPRSTVSTWANKGVVVPDVTWTDETGKDNPGYTFSGLVYLRLIGMLRKESFPLRKAVNAIFHLTDVFGPPGSSWGNARIFSDGRDLWVDHRNEWGVTAATRRGQKAAHELFGPQFALLRERADALLVPRSFGRHVEIDRSVKNGFRRRRFIASMPTD